MVGFSVSAREEKVMRGSKGVRKQFDPFLPDRGETPWSRMRRRMKKQRPKTRLGLPIFTLATDLAPEFCVVIVVMRFLRF
jgi:hypothetical protein